MRKHSIDGTIHAIASNVTQDKLKMPVRDVLDEIHKERELIAAGPDVTVSDAMQIMRENHLQALPICHEENGHPVVDTIVTVADLVHYLCFDPETLARDDLRPMRVSKEWKPKPNKKVLALERDNNAKVSLVVPPDMRLSLCLLPFCHGEHRLVVDDTDCPVPRLVTQSDVIVFLARHLDCPGHPWTNLNDTLRQIGCCFDENEESLRHFRNQLVYTDDPALFAFKKMYDQHHQAVGVVDRKTKELRATMSATDVRLLHADNFRRELEGQNVMQFLEKNQESRFRRVLTLAAHSTVRSALEICAAMKLHRLWITDIHNQPIGIVTLTDILKTFQEH
ncbi:MAG: hypothetical protein MHM6MM_003086 [Cercozoa sp. M6MM]